MKTLMIITLGVFFLSLNVQAELGQKDTACIASKSGLSRKASKSLNKSEEKKGKKKFEKVINS
jgi:hypothetical protein